MRRVLFALILAWACHSTFLGQTTSSKKQDCISNLQVTISPTEMKVGETYTFTASHSKTDFELKYEWTVSYGEILEGQGTPTLKVKFGEEGAGRDLTGTVQVIGLPDKCPASASATAMIVCPPDSTLIDSFKKSTPDIEERLGLIAKRLEEIPDSQLVIEIKFDGKITRTQGEAYIKRLFNYFTKNLSVKPAQILFVASDEGDNTTDVYIVPEGASLPDFPKEHELFKGEDLAKKFSPNRQK